MKWGGGEKVWKKTRRFRYKLKGIRYVRTVEANRITTSNLDAGYAKTVTVQHKAIS